MTDLRLDPGGWDDAIAAGDGPQLVVAGPGAGKTEFLVRRARHLLDAGIPPEEVLLLAFSRRGAAELRSRVAAGLTRSFGAISASTFHSLALRVLESHGPVGGWDRTPTLLTGPEQVALVADLLATEDPAGWPFPFRPLLATGAFAEEVTDFLLRAAERLVDAERVAAMGRDDWRALPGFLSRYRSVLAATGRIDYGTLQVEALRILEHPDGAAAFGGAFRYVLVDEYQDTTVAQARLAECLAAGHRNLTVAGDPYQSVYSFRGAEVGNVAAFPDRFRDRDGNPARRIVLTTSFRVPQAILDAAVRLTAGAGLPGSAGPVIPAPGQGSVETYGFDQQSAEAEWIAAELEHVHLRDRIPYRRMAVLVRSKRQFISEVSRSMERRGIPHQRPDTRLADHPAVRPVLDLADAATGGGSATLRRILVGPLVGLTISAQRSLERKALTRGWPNVLRSEGGGAALVAALLEDPHWATGLPAVEGFWHLWSTLPALPALGRSDRGAGRALGSFAQALDRLRERDPATGLARYAALVRREDFEAEPLISFRGHDTDEVTLTTLHQAKGMDFDVVVVADARDGVFPDLRARDSVLGTRHLTPALSGDERAYRAFRVQEERRLAYTAMCRARVRVVWTCTVAAADHAGSTPSRFLTLVSGLPREEALRPPTERDTPTTPRQAEAWLRRRLGDPTLPAAARLAALGVLAADAPWRPRPITAFAGVLPAGPDGGLLAAEPRLSPSQADLYATCPRRYAFERRLRISDGGSQYADFGSLIHQVLETVERGAARDGREHGSGEHALEVFAGAFPEADFGGLPWADAWRRRGERLLRHLYAAWPGHGPAVSLEETVEHSIGGVSWVGRVDRVEARPDGLHVIDYKTTASPPSKDETSRSLQLAFYVLARGGDVAGAEFWYPAHNAATAKRVTVRSFDMSRLREAEEAMRHIQEGILAESWAATPGAGCERCPVRIVCPEWPEGQEAFA